MFASGFAPQDAFRETSVGIFYCAREFSVSFSKRVSNRTTYTQFDNIDSTVIIIRIFGKTLSKQNYILKEQSAKSCFQKPLQEDSQSL